MVVLFSCRIILRIEIWGILNIEDIFKYEVYDIKIIFDFGEFYFVELIRK